MPTIVSKFVSISTILFIGAVCYPENLRADSISPRYRLGPGDRIQVKLFQVENFDSLVSILPDGTINLPRIPSLSVVGLNLDQARSAIENAYKVVLRRPIAYVDLVGTRPLRVSITGQVQKPGLYSIGLNENNQLTSSDDSNSTTVVSSQGWPTVVEAIQKAGGLTSNGDLRKVSLTRTNPSTGLQEITVINYWDALKNGSVVNNPLIRDGDSVRVPVANNLDNSDLLMVASSSFAPSSISVNVVGEVERPGLQQVKANSPFTQALLSAGGITRKGNQNSIEMFRLQPNGTIEKTVLPYNPNATLDPKKNPPLRDGDVVVVSRHGWAKANDRLKAVVEPLGPLLSGASIFRILGGL
tara:strand:+ start:3058 stop:4125 length:1068 start_codon:yes stop_codon:yes gene_type:complete